MKSSKRNAHPPETDTVVGSNDPDLAGLIRAHAPHDGTFDLGIPGVHVTRASRCARGRESGILAARQFFPARESGRVGRVGAHEHLLLSSALQVRHLDEPLAVPEGGAPSRGETSHVGHHDGCGHCEFTGGISKCFAVQQRI
jgi:hypothetical protein